MLASSISNAYKSRCRTSAFISHSNEVWSNLQLATRSRFAVSFSDLSSTSALLPHFFTLANIDSYFTPRYSTFFMSALASTFIAKSNGSNRSPLAFNEALTFPTPYRGTKASIGNSLIVKSRSYPVVLLFHSALIAMSPPLVLAFTSPEIKPGVKSTNPDTLIAGSVTSSPISSSK